MKNFGIYAIISNPAMAYEDVAEVFADEKNFICSITRKKS